MAAVTAVAATFMLAWSASTLCLAGSPKTDVRINGAAVPDHDRPGSLKEMVS